MVKRAGLDGLKQPTPKQPTEPVPDKLAEAIEQALGSDVDARELLDGLAAEWGASMVQRALTEKAETARAAIDSDAIVTAQITAAILTFITQGTDWEPSQVTFAGNRGVVDPLDAFGAFCEATTHTLCVRAVNELAATDSLGRTVTGVTSPVDPADTGIVVMHLSGPITELVHASASDVPLPDSYDDLELPARAFCVFDTALPVRLNDLMIPAAAIDWTITRTGIEVGVWAARPAVAACYHQPIKQLLPRLVPVLRYDADEADTSLVGFVAALSGWLHSMADATDTVARAPKRARKIGVEPRTVRTVKLRARETGLSASESGGDQSGYSHRWIVSGHWRNQPYGPDRARRRPVFIAPHVKGPDDKPLIPKQQVWSVDR